MNVISRVDLGECGEAVIVECRSHKELEMLVQEKALQAFSHRLNSMSPEDRDAFLDDTQCEVDKGESC